MEKEIKVKSKNSIKVLLVFVAIAIIIVGFVFYKIATDKSYEIEEVTQFSYFKLYENEKYGVIDSMRKYYSGT